MSETVLNVLFSRPKHRPLTCLTLAAVLGLCACSGKEQEAKPDASSRAAIPEVGVITVQPGTVHLMTDLPGRLEPSRVAEVRARATGIVQKRLFTEGTLVRAGQALFQIDPSPYVARQDASQARVTRAQAAWINAQEQVARYRPLLADHFISRQMFEVAVAAERTAQAEVEAAQAELREARINLGLATATAPIDGRIGRALVTEGALVSAQEGTQMALIQQISPLYVNLRQSAADVLRIRRAVQQGLAGEAASDSAQVQIVMSDDDMHTEPGRLLFTDLNVDASSGQVTVRAEVPNRDGLLLPGMYVRVRLQQAQVEQAVLLPQQALVRGDGGDTVTVIHEDGKVERRKVVVRGTNEGQWIITDGLNPGEQVVVEGAQRLRPGVEKAKPVPWKPGDARELGTGAPGLGLPRSPAERAAERPAQVAPGGNAPGTSNASAEAAGSERAPSGQGADHSSERAPSR